MKTKVIAVVLAAGKGSRMHSKIQKQYLELLGRPIITYTLDSFESSHVDEIILVVGPDEIAFAREEIVKKYQYQKVSKVIAGGKERYDSVYLGLCAAEEGEGETCVLIQDGARAFLTPEQVNQSIEAVKEYKACVMAMPVKDTIKMVDDDNFAVDTPDRSRMWQVQTPQCFVLPEIREAYKKMIEAGDNTVTDDAMVMERYGNRRVKMIPGSYDNIKITTPEDLIVGEAILKKYFQNRK
ncbi:MAG: 2-C-methyl-D-erythritol 4-phosphate cytidylyltransferase [Lachnospiraceae bacterium]|nr:2-C-methyl-D-erythritol 4-phosphate cytidylyltransferase [Lachnospiraceae bacterium]